MPRRNRRKDEQPRAGGHRLDPRRGWVIDDDRPASDNQDATAEASPDNRTPAGQDGGDK